MNMNIECWREGLQSDKGAEVIRISDSRRATHPRRTLSRGTLAARTCVVGEDAAWQGRLGPNESTLSDSESRPCDLPAAG